MLSLLRRWIVRLPWQLKRIAETRKIAKEELAALEGRSQRLEELEHDRDALLERYAGMVPEALDGLRPKMRHRMYNKLLRPKILAYPEARLEVSGVLGAGHPV
jgi:DNA repair ATPase RecN